jgi:two-component system LytT family response regulator
MADRIAVAILDDEPPARRRLERLVAHHADLQLAGSYDNPLAARAMLDGVELILLDIEMPFENGFAFLNALPAERKPYVIFVTAHERHAVAAFRHDAVDFLLKPFDEASFDHAIERARRRLRSERLLATADSAPPPSAAAPAELLGVRVPSGEADLVIPPSKIDWLRVEGKIVCIATEGRVYRAPGRLADFEARLAAYRFIRVHRSMLVNADRIRAVQMRSHGDRTLILADGQQVMMSRRYAAALEALTV